MYYRVQELKDKAGAVRTNEHGAHLAAMTVPVEVKAAGDRTIRIVASTEAKDRQGDIVRASGWELAAYLKNPVVLWGHDANVPAIAKATRTWIEDDRLMQDWYFPAEYTAVNGLSEIVYTGLSNGVINAASVGFAPLVRNEIKDESGKSGPWPSYEYTKQELYEVSAVNVPANTEALAVMRSKGIDTRPLEVLFAHGEQYIVRAAEPVMQAPAEPVAAGPASPPDVAADPEPEPPVLSIQFEEPPRDIDLTFEPEPSPDVLDEATIQALASQIAAGIAQAQVEAIARQAARKQIRRSLGFVE